MLFYLKNKQLNIIIFIAIRAVQPTLLSTNNLNKYMPEMLSEGKER